MGNQAKIGPAAIFALRETGGGAWRPPLPSSHERRPGEKGKPFSEVATQAKWKGAKGWPGKPRGTWKAGKIDENQDCSRSLEQVLDWSKECPIPPRALAEYVGDGSSSGETWGFRQ